MKQSFLQMGCELKIYELQKKELEISMTFKYRFDFLIDSEPMGKY